mmetsp:Transcript_41408/g.86917  ORF Transcript_41408/g.86917 Transcript_41408/m.86917 type:complete len:152 (+) Transcript_41408:170-625(+)
MMKLFILVAFVLSTAVSRETYTPYLRHSSTVEDTSSKTMDEGEIVVAAAADDDFLFPKVGDEEDVTPDRQKNQQCIQNCLGENPNNTKRHCRHKCTGNDRSVGPGKIHTTPTGVPYTREHLLCMQRCKQEGKTTAECKAECPLSGIVEAAA